MTSKCIIPHQVFSTLPDFMSGLKENGDIPVYISFGSMEELGFFSSIDCVELLCILNEGKRACNDSESVNLTAAG